MSLLENKEEGTKEKEISLESIMAILSLQMMTHLFLVKSWKAYAIRLDKSRCAVDGFNEAGAPR